MNVYGIDYSDSFLSIFFSPNSSCFIHSIRTAFCMSDIPKKRSLRTKRCAHGGVTDRLSFKAY